MSGWQVRQGVVYVTGAGPGDPELLTVRARRVLQAATLVLYADSLVDPRLLEVVDPAASVRGTSGMTLGPIVAAMVECARAGGVVCRLHSGDPGVYGATSEQTAALAAAGVPWEIVPGVPSPMAAAAALGCALTVPGAAQAVVFCRVRGRTPLPEGQDLAAVARPGVSLCIFLSAAYAARAVATLHAAGIGDDTPAIVAERVSWADERISRGVVGDLEARLAALGVRRQALLLVGPAFAAAPGVGLSALYSPEHAHILRPTLAAREEAGAPPGGENGARGRAGVAVYALTAAGAAVARRIAGGLPGACLHLPARLAGGPGGGALAERGGARGVVARLMATNGTVVLVMATSAAVRLAAPHLEDKLHDPAVVAVDDGGRFAVPLAAAHAGGANRLARRIAGLLGATAVVTTASDGRPWPAPDELARERGWRAENPRALAAVTAALLDGDAVGLVQDAGEPVLGGLPWPPCLSSFPSIAALRAARPRAGLVISDRAVPDAEPGWALLRPPTLVLGVGCTTGVSAAEIVEAVQAALARGGLSRLSVAAVATVDRRAADAGLTDACRAHGWPLHGLAAAELRVVAVPTPSPVVAAAVGTPSVCEAAALLAAGPQAVLALAKVVRGRVTVAVARRAAAGSVAAAGSRAAAGSAAGAGGPPGPRW